MLLKLDAPIMPRQHYIKEFDSIFILANQLQVIFDFLLNFSLQNVCKLYGNVLTACIFRKLKWKESRQFLQENKSKLWENKKLNTKLSLPLLLCDQSSASTRLVLAYLYPIFAENSNRNFHTWPEHVILILASVHMLKLQNLWGTPEARDKGIWLWQNHEEWFCPQLMDIVKANFRGPVSKVLLLIPDSLSNYTILSPPFHA